MLISISIFSCQKESWESNSTGPFIELRSPAPNIQICHFDSEDQSWHLITINENAWPAHQGHGDVRLDDQDNDGYVPDNECEFGLMGDCNDNNADISPVAEEICDNGVDENCNGQVDEDCGFSCHPNEIEVMVTSDTEVYSLYVYPSDIGSFVRWSFTTGWIGANDPWDGKANTDAIIDELGHGIYAASICDRLSQLTGCEWYLPSIGELHAIGNQLGPEGDNTIPSGIYWSSTESNSNVAVVRNFLTGQPSGLGKTQATKARCVRR